ncbi:unnamed protein product [Caenorhabditis angaria]|uniref:cyclin-dependent kinase n=1 Tax=Caenorhabditis angaria TaxID=860376 RepID=A0A9P1MXZ0_9PELO|nr:unnamed protein product [Caenorhabditis angaria]
MSRSSHDEGEISDERRQQSASDDDGSQKESEIRAKLLNKLNKSKRKHSENDDEDERFTIQPKDSQRRREPESREKRKRVSPPSPEKHHKRDRYRDKEKEKHHRRHSRDRKHRRRSSSTEDRKSHRTSEKSHKDGKEKEKEEYKLFERVLEPGKSKKSAEKVIEIEDVEMSPVEILEEDKPISTFTLEAEAGPKKYSKFESDEEEEEEGSPLREDSPEIVEVMEDLDSDQEHLDDEESFINHKWEDLTEEQRDSLTPDVRSRLENDYQKQLISKLPVFYPGIMGCRNIAEYECVNRVDEGTFGVVYRGKDKRTDEIVALKRLKMEKEKEGFPITALREINMLLKAGNHPNIVNVKEILIGTNMDKIYMAMEFVEHDLKSLLDTMKKRNKRFSVGEQKTLLHQLLSGIDHMHRLWILHRDLKTSNLLLSHKGVLKIADFGLAREYGDPLKKFTSVVVTLWYRSPELLLGARYYSTPVDVWSIGCIMAEIILLKPLFPGRGELEQIKKIFMELGTPTTQIWPDVVELEGWSRLQFENYPYNQLRKQFLSGRLLDDTGFKLLMRFLTYDPKNRITTSEALTHEWFSENPLPVPSEDFPTFPAKSEQNQAPPPASKKQQQKKPDVVVDPETAKLLKQLAVKPEHMKPTGFSLKFDPTRF